MSTTTARKSPAELIYSAHHRAEIEQAFDLAAHALHATQIGSTIASAHTGAVMIRAAFLKGTDWQLLDANDEPLDVPAERIAALVDHLDAADSLHAVGRTTGVPHIREVTLLRDHTRETPLNFQNIKWLLTKDQLAQLIDAIERNNWG